MPTTTETNNSANVSVGKGVKGGYIFSGSIDSALPTDYTSVINQTLFQVLGYISEDGITESTEEDSESLKDMNGDIVLSDPSGYEKKFEITLIETKLATLQEYFGQDCVSESNGVITVAEESGARKPRKYIFDLVLSNDKRLRICVPNGKVTEVGEITYKSGELIGYKISIMCAADASGKYTYRYTGAATTASTDTENPVEQGA